MLSRKSKIGRHDQVVSFPTKARRNAATGYMRTGQIDPVVFATVDARPQKVMS